jgi:predicted transcriptional regulator of viral defense system
MAKPLGALETQFFAYAQMRRLQTVRLGELASPLRLSEVQERRLLSQLARKGLIVRVIRGLYLVPSRLPLGGTWSPDEALAINTLMGVVPAPDISGANRGGRRENAGAGRYQICGPNAFNRYGFDEQVPVRVYLYNTRFSGDREIGTVSLALIKLASERLGSTETMTTREGLTLVYSSRVRTLVDAVYDWSRFDSLPRGYDWIRQELAAGRVTVEDLIRDTLRFSNQGTIRRIGFLLEQEGVAEPLLRRLQKALRPAGSPIPWIPNAPKRGKVNARWGIVDDPKGRTV